MENRFNGKRKTGFRRRDAFFLLGLGLAAVILLICYLFCFRKDGSTVTITIDGEAYGSFSLSQDQHIPITIDGAVTNVLMIYDGCAKMEEANCPDQICVNHAAISHEGESIICLPNRVVVTVEKTADVISKNNSPKLVLWKEKKLWES